MMILWVASQSQHTLLLAAQRKPQSNITTSHFADAMHPHHETPISIIVFSKCDLQDVITRELRKLQSNCKRRADRCNNSSHCKHISCNIIYICISWVQQQLNNQPILTFRLESIVVSANHVYFPKLDKMTEKLMKSVMLQAKFLSALGCCPEPC